jgi:hypothetical protein
MLLALQMRQSDPRLDERVLSEILGRPTTSEVVTQPAMNPVPVKIDQHIERTTITSLGSANQIGLFGMIHHGSPG